MLLSFVVPTYNRVNLIQETLDSIFNTKFEVEYEVIIVDDSSSDDTKEIIEAKYQNLLKSGLFSYHYLEKKANFAQNLSFKITIDN